MKYINRSQLMCPGLVLAVSLALLPVSLTAQTAGQSAAENGNRDTGIQIHSWVDRTAIFPGDTVSYHIEIRCSNNIDILVDDLDADELVLSGLELHNYRLEQQQTATTAYYHAVYELISYETDKANLEIDELRVRYYLKRPGQRIEDVATAGEAVVPATALVMRSTLQGEIKELELRDLAAARIQSSWLETSGSLGFLLILLSAIPIALVLSARMRETVPQTRHPLEELAAESFSELELIKKLNAADNRQRLQGFDQLQTLLKDYIEKREGMTASAMTAKEIQQHLAAAETGLSVVDLGIVLEDCERARYGREENLPDARALEDGISLAQSLLSSR